MWSIDALLEEARRPLRRVAPEELESEMAGGAVVVDIRPLEARREEGELPGAVVIDRNVLEWRLAPTSPHRLLDVGDRRVIVVCNEGYASSLAAATLCRLGLDATDMIGGFRAWMAIRTL